MTSPVHREGHLKTPITTFAFAAFAIIMFARRINHSAVPASSVCECKADCDLTESISEL